MTVPFACWGSAISRGARTDVRICNVVCRGPWTRRRRYPARDYPRLGHQHRGNFWPSSCPKSRGWLYPVKCHDFVHANRRKVHVSFLSGLALLALSTTVSVDLVDRDDASNLLLGRRSSSHSGDLILSPDAAGVPATSAATPDPWQTWFDETPSFEPPAPTSGIIRTAFSVVNLHLNMPRR